MSELGDQPVVVVGGAIVGLTTSLLLSHYGVKHVLFERHNGTSIHPKAVSINQRTGEIFKELGLYEKIRQHACPPIYSQRVSHFTNIGPNGREITSHRGFGTGIHGDAYAKASPCHVTNLAQIFVEPILKKEAEKRNRESVLFNHEVLSLSESDDGVVVSYKNRSDGVVKTLKTQYVIGADGGAMVGKAAAIGLDGVNDMMDMVTVHFRSPIMDYHPDPTVLITWLVEPSQGGGLNTGAIYHIGPYPLVSTTQTWVYVFARLPHERAQHLTEDQVLARTRASLGIEDIPITLISTSYWHIHARVATKFRSSGGRLFLVGDAAHQHPPYGALGANTGVHDAENLVWKLALALGGQHPNVQRLLNSYESERKPIAHSVIQKTVDNMQQHMGEMDGALGLSPEKKPQDNIRAMEQYFDMEDLDVGQKKREEVRNLESLRDTELFAHGNEIGWFYDNEHFQRGHSDWKSPQINSDGTFDQVVYHPSTVPGHHLPHSWLEKAGVRMSTREIREKSKLMLWSSSTAWKVVENPWIEFVHVTGSDDPGNHQSWTDANGAWAKQRQVEESGAVLVRPDGIVGYRWMDSSILQGSGFQEKIQEVVQQVLMLDKMEA